MIASACFRYIFSPSESTRSLKLTTEGSFRDKETIKIILHPRQRTSTKKLSFSDKVRMLMFGSYTFFLKVSALVSKK